ncbi:MAG TPA: glycogen synthase GlgA [Terriglobia bacterium]
MRVVFVAPEGVPFSKTGGLADVIGGLPRALVQSGLQVDVLLPRYRSTSQGPTIETGRSLTIPLSAGFRFASVQNGGLLKDVQYYLIDCPEFFDRDGLYQDSATGLDYPDNYLRYGGFCLAALEFIKRLGPPPEIIHCHDWQTGLAPVYLRRNYGPDLYYSGTRVVFTIHNLAYHPEFPRATLSEISLDDTLFHMDALEYFGRVNVLKGGLVFADALTTVSPKYAEEIQTPEFGAGLEGVLQRQAWKLRGILNGVDYEAWNPATDPLIPAHYSPEDLRGKKECKRTLLERMGVEQPALSRPVLGMVSRFDRQKGFDLLAEIAESLAALDLYLVVLGTGTREYEEFFERLAKRYPGKFLVKIAYDNTLAHLIEAGSDIFLMPSRYEPSGLNQMYSLKYGTVPVVRGTGGLENTIDNFDGTSGTGFKFYEYTGHALLDTISRALEAFRWPRLWARIMLNGMLKDFSWTRSAREYAELYQAISPAKVAPEPPEPQEPAKPQAEVSAAVAIAGP